MQKSKTESDSVNILSVLLQYVILKLISTGYNNSCKNQTVVKMGFFFGSFCVVVSLSPRQSFINWLTSRTKEEPQSKQEEGRLTRLAHCWAKCSWCAVVIRIHSRRHPCQEPGSQNVGRRAEVRRARGGKHCRDVSVRDQSMQIRPQTYASSRLDVLLMKQ